MYVHGTTVHVRKTPHLDASLLAKARAESGETVRLGLEALVRGAAYERLRALRGPEPAATHVPRRREKPARRRRVA
jgi:hypothetical protein